MGGVTWRGDDWSVAIGVQVGGVGVGVDCGSCILLHRTARLACARARGLRDKPYVCTVPYRVALVPPCTFVLPLLPVCGIRVICLVERTFHVRTYAARDLIDS
jgi:hypothetical protein